MEDEFKMPESLEELEEKINKEFFSEKVKEQEKQETEDKILKQAKRIFIETISAECLLDEEIKEVKKNLEQKLEQDIRTKIQKEKENQQPYTIITLDDDATQMITNENTKTNLKFYESSVIEKIREIYFKTEYGNLFGSVIGYFERKSPVTNLEKGIFIDREKNEYKETKQKIDKYINTYFIPIIKKAHEKLPESQLVLVGYNSSNDLFKEQLIEYLSFKTYEEMPKHIPKTLIKLGKSSFQLQMITDMMDEIYSKINK